MPVTIEQFQACAPTCPHLRVVGLLPHLNAALKEFGIVYPTHIAAFMAQCGHETLDFRHFQELWGPTEQQKKYEPGSGSKVAERLGNVISGDGVRYRGRGVIQLTGRSNYRQAGQALGVKFEEEPRKAASADHAFRVAGWYWKSHRCNEWLDTEGFDAVTRAINGGLNGKADRDARYERALKVFGADRLV